jgi:hypothetical protein
MALRKKGKYYFGESAADIRPEILRYSKLNGYPATHFADAVCTCGGQLFQLQTDGDAGVAIRICAACQNVHLMGDSAEYLEDAKLDSHECNCLKEVFEITVGVSLYDDSNDLRWLYLGCRCPSCGLTGVYGDWKNEFEGYERLLGMV